MKAKCRWKTSGPYFVSSNESHPDVIPCMWKFSRKIIITRIITGTRYHCIKEKCGLFNRIQNIRDLNSCGQEVNEYSEKKLRSEDIKEEVSEVKE